MNKTVISFIEIVTPQNTYRLCASGQDVILNGVIYDSVDFTLKDISSKSGQDKKGTEGFTLVLPLSHPLAKELKVSGSNYTATGTFQLAAVTPGSSNYGVTPFISFTGYLISTSAGVHEILLGFGTLRGKLKEEGLPLAYSNFCSNSLHDNNCKATKIAVKYNLMEVSNSQGTDMSLLTCEGQVVDKQFLVNILNTATYPAPDSSYLQLAVIANPTLQPLLAESIHPLSPSFNFLGGFAGLVDDINDGKVISMQLTESAIVNGYVSYLTTGGVMGRSQILSVNQSSPTEFHLVVSPAPVDISTTSIEVYMGCDLLFETCQNAFSNTTRFGGFPFFTGKENPFTGSYLD